MRVLVADDEIVSRLVVETIVTGLGHECITAADGDEAWAKITKLRPDVLVSDRDMPGIDGLELTRRLRAPGASSYTYVVLVTSLADQAQVLEGMRAGADDYIVKPLHPFDLEARLLAAERVTALHAELGATRAALAAQARTDALTGLRNRLHLTEELHDLDAAASRRGRPWCVTLCDVDLFKPYNDTYGHPAGDEVLRNVARTIRSNVRESDRVYRFGGEEFLILMPEEDLQDCALAVQRVLDAVADLRIEHTASPHGHVTMSAGAAAWTPERPLRPELLLEEADQALYLAKERGRAQLVTAGPDLAV